MKILQFPLTKVVVGFLFGIMVFRMVTINPIFLIRSMAIFLVVILVSHYYNQRNSFFKNLFGSSVILMAILIGMSTALIHKESLNPYHYTNQIRDYDKNHTLTIVINEKLKNTTRNKRFSGSVLSLDGKKSFGKIILNITNAAILNRVKVGSHLKVIGSVYSNKKPFNPSLFDYSGYLENQEIYAQVYTKPHQIKIVSFEPSLWADFSNFREKIISNLKNSAISNEELNVLNALILGQQQDISTTTLKDYQYAGAVHVLSVSGLHVGFILMFITFILKPIGNSRKGSLLKVSIVVLSLWAFAILTGLSPSIVRSATMFSFLAVGTHLRRTVNIYHTLLVSMLLILLFKPSFLFDVGFQLSYIALFFIVWLQPLLASIWLPNNKIIKYFWDIITVSFAAQIGAMPLSIYYFHQFPGLFFVTNLLILPLLGIIMAVGVVAILIATIQAVPFWIAKPLEYSIRLLNYLIHWVASLDDFVIKNISFSKEMLWSSYLMIVLLILWSKKPEFKRLVFVFISIIVIQLVCIVQKHSLYTQEELIVFNVKKNTIITERIGEEVTVFSNDSILSNLNHNNLLQSYLVGNFCQATQKKRLSNLLYFKHQKILVLDSACLYPKGIHPDILVLIQSPKLNMQRLLNTNKPKQIVADGSNYTTYVRLWEATCQKAKIPFHYTNEKGFYKL